MTRQEFYDIMEMFGAYASIPPKTHAMMEILEMYPNLKSMTCEDALEWLKNRDFEWYQKLQKKLGVEDGDYKAILDDLDDYVDCLKPDVKRFFVIDYLDCLKPDKTL